MTTKRKISNIEFWKNLTEGNYKVIIDYASKRENDLDVQIRDNYLNIYYKGGNLLRIHPRSLYFDEFYYHRGAIAIRKTQLIKKSKEGDKDCIARWKSYKKERDKLLNQLKDSGDIERYCAEMKIIMDDWAKDLGTIGISHDEKNEQQLISMNNRGATQYTVIDLEYTVSRLSSFSYDGQLSKKVPRFDIIAVDRFGQLFVIELKTGLGSIKGNSGISPHMDCFNHTIGSDAKNDFVIEMAELLKQKQDLNLIDNKVYIDTAKKPQFIFAFSDKQGEDSFEKFVNECNKNGYNGKVIYVDNEHHLKYREDED